MLLLLLLFGMRILNLHAACADIFRKEWVQPTIGENEMTNKICNVLCEAGNGGATSKRRLVEQICEGNIATTAFCFCGIF